VTSYRIYHGPTLDSVTRAGEVSEPRAVFDETGCFRITAVNADGESPMTAGVCL
jgi:hypothetical protein